MIAAADSAGAAFLGIFIAVGLIALAIAWIIFPFLMLAKCNEIIRELKKLTGGKN